MQIKLYTWEDDWYARRHYIVIGDEENGRTIGGGEPEDACIGRDLVDGHEIIAYIKSGFDAAKAGEEIEVEVIESKPPNW